MQGRAATHRVHVACFRFFYIKIQASHDWVWQWHRKRRVSHLDSRAGRHLLHIGQCHQVLLDGCLLLIARAREELEATAQAVQTPLRQLTLDTAKRKGNNMET